VPEHLYMAAYVPPYVSRVMASNQQVVPRRFELRGLVPVLRYRVNPCT
jgi:hypothetical protein